MQSLPLRTIKQSLLVWYDFADLHESMFDSMSEPLWFNRRITHNKKPLFNQCLAKAGLVSVFQVINPNGSLFQYSDIMIKFNVTCNRTIFTDYNKLIAAIPLSWLQTPFTTSDRFEKLSQLLISSFFDNKSRYSIFVSAITNGVLKPQLNWASDFCTELNWSAIYLSLYTCTIETKLRAFNYKFVMRAIPLNSQLFSFGVIPSPLCTFCNSENETLMHLFFECATINCFWNNVCDFISNHYQIDINCLSHKTKAFSLDRSNVNVTAINCCLSSARFVINRAKIQNNVPTFNDFFYFMKNLICSERYVSIRNNKFTEHIKKWSTLFLRL